MHEFPGMKGFSGRNLKYMRRFADAWRDLSIVQELLAQITWYHHIALADPEIVGIRILTLLLRNETHQVWRESCRISAGNEVIPEGNQMIVAVERAENADRNHSFVIVISGKPVPVLPGYIHTTDFSPSTIILPVKYI